MDPHAVSKEELRKEIHGEYFKFIFRNLLKAEMLLVCVNIVCNQYLSE